MGNPSAIDGRRMIRRYSPRELDAATLDALLGAALRAPSPHNRQPWRFAVVRGAARDTLARAMGARLRADSERDGLDPGAIEQDLARSYQRITTAQACILACLSMQDMDAYPDARRSEAEHWMAGQAVAAAVQNILLRATELGVGACWMCGPLFCQQTVVSALGLPGDWEPQVLVTLGYPADAGKDRPRKPIDEVTMRIGH